MRKKLIMLGLIWVSLVLGGCGEVELETPDDFEYEYSEEDNSVCFVWEEVENATGYEIDYGNGSSKQNVGNKTTCVLLNPVDGVTYVAKVRAVCEKESGTYYSDWESLEYTVPVWLEMPENLTLAINGAKLEMYWDEAKGATGYEVTASFEDGTVKGPYVFESNSVTMKVYEGDIGTVTVRAIRENSAGTYYTEEINADFSIPVVDLASVYYTDAFLFDYERLINWADYNGFEYEVSETVVGEETYIMVDVSCSDALNSGFWNMIGRVVESATEGFVDGYVTESYDTYTSDFASVENTLMTLLTNDSVKEYVSDVDEAATNRGVSGAIVSGLDALLMDTDRHYRYYYLDQSKAAICSVCFFLKNGRENYMEDNFGNFTAGEDGRYHLLSYGFQQDFHVEVQQELLGSYDYWVVYSSKR